MDKRLKAFAADFKRELRGTYGDRLVDVHVFDSSVNDIGGRVLAATFAIILSDYEDLWTELQRTGEAASRIAIDHEADISRRFFTVEQWEECRHQFPPFPTSTAVPA
jgi:hypothetical protein